LFFQIAPHVCRYYKLHTHITLPTLPTQHLNLGQHCVPDARATPLLAEHVASKWWLVFESAVGKGPNQCMEHCAYQFALPADKTERLHCITLMSGHRQLDLCTSLAMC
jgi:hypothetical protein